MIPKKRKSTSLGLWTLYGALFAVALVGLKFVELSYMSNRIGTEFYVALIAVGFLAIGLAIGRRRDAVGPHTDQGHTPLTTATEQTGATLNRDHDLTARELEVLTLLAEGRTNQEIAESLFVSPHTIKTHVANVCRKLAVERRGQAVARARERNIIP